MMNLTLSRRALAMGAFATGALCVAINALTAPTSISNEPLASPVTVHDNGPVVHVHVLSPGVDVTV